MRTNSLVYRAGLALVSVVVAIPTCFVSISSAAPEPRQDMWKSPAGATKCRWVNDGSGDFHRGSLQCLVVARNLTVTIHGGQGNPTISRTSTSTRARYVRAKTLPYGKWIVLGPLVRRAGYSSHSYACSVSESTGTFCYIEGNTDFGWRALHIRRGVIRMITSENYDFCGPGDKWWRYRWDTWSSGRWVRRSICGPDPFTPKIG